MLHFGKIPKTFGYIWRKFIKTLAKFVEKNSRISAIFNEKIEIRERCKGIEPQYQGHWHLVSYVVLDSIGRNGA